ncbi:hypothetical protein Tco_0532500 [Tanacetum coccineum]
MPNNGQAVSQLKYSRVIGCLMYAMTYTRRDIAFAVGKLSTYTSNPITQQWQAIQRVLKYLKKNIDYRLTYNSVIFMLEGYTNASWISNTEDNSSTSALTTAGKEAKWLKNLLLEIPLWSKPIAPISIRYDSAATLAKAYSADNGKRKIHFLLSSMSVVYVLTTPMPEDGGDNTTVEQVRKRAKWDNNDYVCRGLILDGMSDPLFDIYQNVESFP